MCGRYGLTRYPSGLIRALGGKPRAGGASARYNIAPAQPVPAIVNDDERSLLELRWGLVPAWADDPSRFRMTAFNARIETIATAPAFRDSLRSRRCAVLADGYYEWRKNPDGSKTPFWIARRDGEPFAFAGLWAVRRRGDDVLASCTIVTQPPNAYVATIHPRMPVVLDPIAYDAWLEAGERDAADMLALLEPARSEDFIARVVSRRVGNVRNDDPSLIEEAADAASLFSP